MTHNGLVSRVVLLFMTSRLTLLLLALSAGVLAAACARPVVRGVQRQPEWIEVAPCQSERFECGKPVQVELVEPTISVDVTSNGYVPQSDVILGTFNIEPGQTQDPMLYQISAEGDVRRAWRITNKHGGILGDRRMLPNGHILFTVFKDGVYEIDPDGNVVWQYLDEGLSHHAEILPNGNVLIAGSYCDCVKEIDYETGKPIWEWHARDLFRNYDDEAAFPDGRAFGHKSAYATYSRPDRIKPIAWAHLNHAQVLPNGHVLVSLRNFDLVLELTRAGQVVWSFGPGIIKHQHTPRILEDGTLAVFDNGNRRAIVVDRASQEILWEYRDLKLTGIMGEINRLADGNYKILSSIENLVLVVSPKGEVLWRMTITTPEPTLGIYRAHLPGLEP